MRQLTYVKRGTLQWWDAAEPVLQKPTDAIVRPLAAARCDGDKVFLFHNVTELLRFGMAVHYVDPIARDIFGSKPFEGPFAIGHECVAEVVACGEDVKGFTPGDVVVVPWSISCGNCANCQAQITSRCLRAGDTFQSGYGLGKACGEWGGMVSDRLRVPYAQNMLVAVPAGVDPVSIASASDNIPDGWRTVAPHLDRYPGAPVLVVGGSAASVGVYAAGIAVAKGSEQVDYLDYDRQRLEIAASLGAKPQEIPRANTAAWLRRNAPRRGGKYPITVDASSTLDGLRFAIRSLAPGGICTGVGYYFKKDAGLPLMQMYANCSTLHIGISNPRATLPEVLALIGSKSFRPELVTSVRADWDDADEAFLERTAKVVVSRAAMFSSTARP
ncbi:MAG: alcohol dehydrogenase catalytic domain-containing protein [Saprospiraceae bacterium]